MADKEGNAMTRKRSSTRSNQFAAVREAMKTLRSFQQRKVVVAGEARRAQVVHDDEHRHGAVEWDHNRARNTGFGVDARLPMNRSNARHVRRLGLKNQLHLLRGNQRRGIPARAGRITRNKTFFAKEIFHRSQALAFFQEETDSFQKTATSFINRVATTGNRQLRAQTHKRLTLFKDERGKRNLTHHDYTIPNRRDEVNLTDEQLMSGTRTQCQALYRGRGMRGWGEARALTRRRSGKPMMRHTHTAGTDLTLCDPRQGEQIGNEHEDQDAAKLELGHWSELSKPCGQRQAAGGSQPVAAKKRRLRQARGRFSHDQAPHGTRQRGARQWLTR